MSNLSSQYTRKYLMPDNLKESDIMTDEALGLELERISRLTPAQVDAELRAAGIDPDAAVQAFENRLLRFMRPAGRA